MCLIIYKDIDNPIPDFQLFEEAYTFNSDGFGLMFPHDGRIVHDKTIGNLDMIESIFQAYSSDNLKMAYHLRFGTHGTIDNNNCHPFEILSLEKDGKDLFLMHNGILAISQWDLSMSDTWHFVNDWLKPILQDNPHLINKKWFCDLIGYTIGYGNKFLLMDGEGNTYIINESAGTRSYLGHWLSNNLYTISHDDPATRQTAAHGRWGSKVGWSDYYDDNLDYYYNNYNYNNTLKDIGETPENGNTQTTDLIESKSIITPITNYLDWEYLQTSDLYQMTRKEILQLTWENPEIVTDWIYDIVWNETGEKHK